MYVYSEITESVRSQCGCQASKTMSFHSPVGQQDWGEKAPDVEQHADPTGYYAHPHCDLRPADVDIVVRIARFGDVGNDIPAGN
jgi:hypothetical protein